MNKNIKEGDNMSKEYKSLNLVRGNIIGSIKNFCSINFSESSVDNNFEEKDNTRRRLNIVGDEKKFHMDFHFNSNGTTTIEDFGGNHVSIKQELAYFIKNDSNCQMGDNSKNKWFVAKNIKNNDFDSIIELIKESEYFKSIVEEKTDEGKSFHQYKGVYNENLTIEYYNTKTVVLKGRPLLLFNEVMAIIAELIDLDDIPKVFNDYYNVSIMKDDISEQYEVIMKNSWNKQPSTLKKVLLQSVYNSNLEGDMFEYTYLVFPALRALEGHLKYIAKNYSLALQKDQVGSLYYYDKTNKKYYLSSVNSAKLDHNKIKHMEKAYNHYHVNRHGLFHWNDVTLPLDNTRTIDSIGEARQLITDTLKLIDEYYIL